MWEEGQMTVFWSRDQHRTRVFIGVNHWSNVRTFQREGRSFSNSLPLMRHHQTSAALWNLWFPDVFWHRLSFLKYLSWTIKWWFRWSTFTLLNLSSLFQIWCDLAVDWGLCWFSLRLSSSAHLRSFVCFFKQLWMICNVFMLHPLCNTLQIKVSLFSNIHAFDLLDDLKKSVNNFYILYILLSEQLGHPECKSNV